MREEEAAEGEGVEAGEGERSEQGLGGLQRPWAQKGRMSGQPTPAHRPR